ncbi:MAG: transposase [Terriglobales bacterium]
MFCRRLLPHWQPRGRPLFVTFRLFDRSGGTGFSLCTRRLQPAGTPLSAGERFLLRDRADDRASSGHKWLRDPAIAGIVRETILGAELRGFCRLHAWVIMPNNVHLLLTPEIAASELMQEIKGRSARGANAALGRTGQPFWQAESYDRWVRGAAEAARIRRYIERNPVAAGLVTRAEAWSWSSAYRGGGGPMRQAEACRHTG